MKTLLQAIQSSIRGPLEEVQFRDADPHDYHGECVVTILLDFPQRSPRCLSFLPF